MVKTFRCADAGIACTYETAAATREELLQSIAGHAQSTHGFVTVPPALLRRIYRAIRG